MLTRRRWRRQNVVKRNPSTQVSARDDGDLTTLGAQMWHPEGHSARLGGTWGDTRRDWDDGGVKGRLFVAAQGVLIVLVVLAPRLGDGWSAPPWVAWVGWALAAAGVVVALAAFPQLGRALTPLPEPRADAGLVTSGLYRWVRHPIYSGVLAMAWGWTLAHPTWATAVAALTLTVLLATKSRYEEGLLVARFADYAEYAARTPRFVPRPWL